MDNSILKLESISLLKKNDLGSETLVRLMNINNQRKMKVVGYIRAQKLTWEILLVKAIVNKIILQI